MDFDIAWPLPLPDSAELTAILPSAEHRRIYEFLYDRRDNPPTKVEILDHLAELTGETHSQRDRRLRDLYPYFRIDRTPERRPRYVLVSRNRRPTTRHSIGERAPRYSSRSAAPCAAARRSKMV